MITPRTLAVAAAGAVLVLGLAGCTASSAGSSAAVADRVPAAAAAPASGGAASSASGTARDIVRTGTLDLSAKNPIAAAAQIGALVTGAAGHLDADAEQPGRNPTAQLTARIPATAFDATLHAIERAGQVRSLTLHAADVTAQVTDDSVRIAALQASVARLTTLLSRASDTSDLVSLEGALTTRESDLQSLQAQQRGLADQVSYASLTVSITAPAAAPVARPGTFASGFAAGWAALGATATWLAVAVGVLAPWLVVIAVLAVAALAVRRLVRRPRMRQGEP